MKLSHDSRSTDDRQRYGCRRGYSRRPWGSCTPASIDSPSSRAGTCVDNYGCSGGCQYTNPSSNTITCAGSNTPYCSAVVLQLPNNPEPVTYVSCGRVPNPNPDLTVPFATLAPVPTGAAVVQTTITETITTTVSQALPTNIESSTTSSSPTNTPTPTRTTNTNTTPDSSTTPPDPSAANPVQTNTPQTNTGGADTNVGAIVGGAIGAIALVLLLWFAVICIGIRRRKKQKTRSKASASSSLKATPPPVPEVRSIGAQTDPVPDWPLHTVDVEAQDQQRHEFEDDDIQLEDTFPPSPESIPQIEPVRPVSEMRLPENYWNSR
ncbi:hypothetical protein QBC44DRAFT_372281 [Cladorrhinum sp. PSN332]|nr:hypothetical protein QBC44DRAFT_372281 [Cladorrhinum sp. PSN332]